MTILHLYRVTLETRTGIKVYARRPDREGCPVAWTNDPERADVWGPAAAIEVHCSLRREHKPARLERCDETITD